jgi:hypothetical protein
MTYRSGGLIQAIDFNNLVGPDTTSSTEENLLNTLWATGVREAGYGQTSVPNVDQYDLVSASDWANLISTMNNVATHQGTTFTTPITPPVTNNEIAFISNLKSNLNLLYANKNNAAVQAATQSTTTRFTPSKWINRLNFKFIITFNTGDKARYFFNAGGQIAINFSHVAVGGINTVFKNICTEAGTLVISAPTGTDSCEIADQKYFGVTKIGGSASSTILKTATGYFNLTNRDQLIFKQNPDPVGIAPGFREYAESSISVYAKVSGAQGTNGDVGSIITLNIIWEQSPATEFITQGNDTGPVNNSTTTVSLRYPSSSTTGGVLTNTWGTATIVGTVQGF